MNVKTLLCLILLASTGAAHAASVSVEASAGVSYGTPRNNGTWYQKGFPHQLHTRSSALSLGLRADLSSHIAVHADAYWLGKNSSHARAVGVDALYSPTTPNHCVGPCPALSTYIGSGWTGGVRLLADFHTTGPWQVGLLIGPIAFREAWRMHVPDFYAMDLQPNGTYKTGPLYDLRTSDARWFVSGAVGLRLSHGHQFAELMFYRDARSLNHNGQFWPPIWKHHWTLSYGFTF